jgi:hypothetical protein
MWGAYRSQLFLLIPTLLLSSPRETVAAMTSSLLPHRISSLDFPLVSSPSRKPAPARRSTFCRRSKRFFFRPADFLSPGCVPAFPPIPPLLFPYPPAGKSVDPFWRRVQRRHRPIQSNRAGNQRHTRSFPKSLSPSSLWFPTAITRRFSPRRMIPAENLPSSIRIKTSPPAHPRPWLAQSRPPPQIRMPVSASCSSPRLLSASAHELQPRVLGGRNDSQPSWQRIRSRHQSHARRKAHISHIERHEHFDSHHSGPLRSPQQLFLTNPDGEFCFPDAAFAAQIELH